MSEEDLRASQYEEVEAIKAMYPGDVEDGESDRPQFTISLYPQRGSSGGGAPLENITFVKLHVAFPPMYPKVIPKITIKEYKGLSAQEIQELSTELRKKCEENIGEVLMYPVLLLAEEFLYAHQKKPTGSFHDEMLMRNKLLQERNLQMQMMFKEKERLAIREEILRKQEEMKEEQRRRREVWRNQSDVIPNDNVEASPTKSDSFCSVRPPMLSRRKRRSISCRRRRSNSEGSDSSLSEGSDLVMLEFISGKSVQYFYKGEIIGRSNRGSTVYAGIGQNGSLVAIYEWKFAIPVDRKGKPLGSGSDVLTTDGLIKQDTGEDRTDSGQFIEERSPSFRHNFEKLGGISPRKVVKIFNPDFLNEMQPIYTGFQTTLYIKDLLPSQLNNEELNCPGYLCTFKVFGNNSGTMLRYGSELETLQAIAYLNQNGSLTNSGEPAYIYNINFSKRATLDYKQGLGINGELIRIEDLYAQNGFVPLSSIATKLIDTSYKDAVEGSTICKRCEGPYEIIGISPFLNSFACRCSCYYDSDLGIENKSKAVFWKDEKFTRIVCCKNLPTGQDDAMEYCVQFEPVKRTYRNTKEYLNVQLPLLFEEWKTMAEEFKKINATNGRVVKMHLVDRSGDQESIRDLHAMQIEIPVVTEVWTDGNPACVKELTIIYKQDGKPFRKWKKAKLFRMASSKNGIVCHIQLTLNEQNLLRIGSAVHLIPKPNKSEYNGTKMALNKWNNATNSQDSPITKVLLNPMLPADQWELQTTPTVNIHYYLIKPIIEKWVHSACNELQRVAIEKAIKSNVSFLHGPPGTGKTYTLAVLINLLYHKEKGVIVVAAPSNFAADGIAKSILKNHPPTYPPPSVLRIFADSKEQYPQVERGNTSRDSRSAVMHAEVQRIEEWLNTEDIADIADRARANKLVLLKERELEKYRAHKRGMEKEIMQEYDVFVLTVAALADKRVEAWAAENTIATIIVDEAGQLKHPSSVGLSGIKAARYIFAGDPEQLPPNVESKAALLAGLEMSLMDITFLCGAMRDRDDESFPPWTTLLVQHRMHSEIRKLTSCVFYNDKLKDAAEDLGDVDDDTRETGTYYAKRLVVLNHNFHEEKRGNSRVNRGEANIIVEKIEQLIRGGVNPGKILVLTLYDSQRKLILDKLHAKNLGVQALNVDAFQGREFPLVFLSITRSNNTGDIGFAAIPNRLCVAISRAQQYLFIAFNLKFHEKLKLQHWKLLCKYIKANALIVNCDN